ncbi:hypothetical protein [Corynebacterium minutissimum]|uniref:Uncharacterized protein n=1 Tax=Corynebacterium minutissimum TaxID=38301 RepID=A0A376CXI8_9CORY|nr:hypothetical protein [Corynebacterium minutissimum]QRP60885.1 hypothetical protein I6J26_12180 [Corynebacterium minutissimum]STC77567.1 Uncharacterised protein [Corynebacterium minutissimum]STD79100.1 Uncharacterised protein [Corynebacterium minutissimum]
MALKLVRGPRFITADFKGGKWVVSSTAWASDSGDGRLKLVDGNFLIHAPGGGAIYAIARSGGTNGPSTSFNGSAVTGKSWMWYVISKTDNDQPLIIFKLE